MRNETVSSTVPNLPIHIGYGKHRNSGSCPIHFHDEIELLIVTDGKMICTVGDKDYEILSGEAAFINSRVPHSTVTAESSSTGLIQVNLDAFSDDKSSKYLSRFINSSENSILIFKSGNKDTELLCGYLEKIIQEYQDKDNAYDIYIKANIYNVLAFLYRNKVLINVESNLDTRLLEKVMPALEYVNNNYNEPITLETISCLLNLDQFYFCRLFKKATKSTFTEYLNFVRVCKAEKILTETTKNVMEVSLDVGFSSVSYFNRTFKKIKNCTPTNYRKIKYAQA